MPEAALKAHAKRLRDDLLSRGIDKVNLFGSRDEEIWVEAKEQTLRRLDLTLADISERIAVTSVDLPSGNIGQGLRQVRSLGLLTDANSLGGVEIKALDDGRKIYLRDIAEVREAFDDNSPIALRNNEVAIELHLMRALDSDALVLAREVTKYLNEIEDSLPTNLKIERYDSSDE